jgi:hypothetical protein
MGQALTALFGAMGSAAFFAFLSFAIWIDYRKKKDDRDAAHAERLKALELGFAPLDGEIERAKAYASAAWAAGLIGLLVPLAIVIVAFIGTIVAVLNHEQWENITVPLIVAWSISGVAVLAIATRCLSVIRQLPQPRGDTVARTAPNNSTGGASTRFQESPTPKRYPHEANDA